MKRLTRTAPPASYASVWALAAVCCGCGGNTIGATATTPESDAGAPDVAEEPEGGSGGTAGSSNLGGAAGGISGQAGVAGQGGGPIACMESCAPGCCDSTGNCQPGTELHACGIEGQACSDCLFAGYDSCDATLQACAKDLGYCHPQNCPTGCCTGALCVAGASSGACGTGGVTCKTCENGCDLANSKCIGNEVCNPYNCANGCCLAGACVPGKDGWACGTGGTLCENCTLSGKTCQVEPVGLEGGQCKPPLCDSSNCAGCCVGDLCAIGTQQSACGSGGKLCADCLAESKQCKAGVCE
jgi:hypothetical protein